ncbi:hypothetical protein CCACVL1_16168 [Corchorus capsularis]|uniref:Uncharacterized protein n=1 Tax=Corchorus capsularis TaxID=210143 RepID=A0A1R3HYN1_COCAP|nr:hypothetical protein CCACVL1_16168 [Corchorus capsularis]
MYVTRPLSWYKRFPAELQKCPSAEGQNYRKTFKSCRREDMPTDCYGNRDYSIVNKPQPADHRDIYQKFKFYSRHWTMDFSGISVASDGIPPSFLRVFSANTLTAACNFELGEARGLDIELRTRLPEFDFPLSCKTSERVVVGKWKAVKSSKCDEDKPEAADHGNFKFYSRQLTVDFSGKTVASDSAGVIPRLFLGVFKDGKPEDQVAKSTYYEMTLEQRWEQVFACDNIIGDYNEVNVVVVDVKVEREVFRVGGNEKEALRYGSVMGDNGVMWFKSCNKEGKEEDIGLSLAIVERMKWEQER